MEKKYSYKDSSVSDSLRLQIKDVDGRKGIVTGTGTPEGVVTANVGSLYTNTAGGVSTTLYVKTSGTGNTEKTNILLIMPGSRFLIQQIVSGAILI